MTHPLTVVLTSVAITGVLVAVAACSSAPTPNPAGGTSGTSGGSLGDDDDDTTNPPAGTSGGVNNDAGRGDGGVTEAQCIAGPAPQCADCCTRAHDKGSKAYDVALLKCICTTPGACQAECATTFCATPFQTPNAACNTCIRGAVDGACMAQLTTECNAEPDCPALYGCFEKCPTP
jgi:hypothetical protein